MRKILIIAGVVIIFFTCQSRQSSQFQKIKQGEFEATITETGELQAVNSRVIVMPNLGWKYGRPKIARLVEEGSVVKEGDFIVEIDNSGIIKILRQKENELEIARADQKKLLVNHENQVQQLNSALTSSEASYTMEKIQAQKIKFESETRQKVSVLRLEKSGIALEKIKKQIRTNKIMQAKELQIQKLKIFKLENEVENARIALKRVTLTAPGNGLVEYKKNRRTDQKIRVGDELWPGASLVGIPDLSRMKVLTKVNELDINKIRTGQNAIVRLDAFPEKPFNGAIVEVAKLCQTKKNDPLIKLFDVEILLEESDPILKPGMTVSCEVFTAKLVNVLFVENECIFKEDAKSFLYIKDKSDVEKREVKIGPRNNKFTVIYGDFKPGQQVKIH
jgi:HlyD family secretion protein